MAFVQEFKRAELSGGAREPVHRDPCLHIRREVEGPLKGWSPFYQPLPSPRLVLVPYIGCVSRCQFCFLRSFPGLHRLGTEEMIITVYSNYPEHFRDRLSNLCLVPPVVLSPFTDPFQPINDRYGLAEKLTQICVLNNLPLELVTRYHVPDEVLAMMEYLPHARVQISVDPLNREGEVPYWLERLDVLERVRRLGINGVLRLDPIAPVGEQLFERLEKIVKEAAERDIPHLVTRFLQAPSALHEQYVQPHEECFEAVEERSGWWQVRSAVRHRVLCELAGMCETYGLSLGVLGDSSLQDRFGSFERPYSDYLPLSYRNSTGESFRPVEGCQDDCKRCLDNHCGLKGLVEKPWRDKRFKDTFWRENGFQRLQGELLQ